MKVIMRPQNQTEDQPTASVLPESDDGFDREVVGWFTQHGGAWSGTAAELLAAVRTRASVGNDLWPQSGRALYAHLESDMRILRSLGVDVVLRHGYPRIVSLRPCQNQKPSIRPPSDASGINHTSDLPIKLPLLADDQKTSPAASCDLSPAASEMFSQDIPVAKSGAKFFANEKHAGGDNSERGVFENTAEALLAIVEMGGRIREQVLDLKSAIDLVVGRSQEITQCSGIAVGLLQHDSVVYPTRVGIAGTMAGLHFQANLFKSCLRTGKALQLREAQKDTLVGPMCRREGIKSLIIVPIFLNGEIAGAMELLFKEMRSFSSGDLMTLELIADVISEGLSGAGQIEKQGEERECSAEPKPIENILPQHRHSLNEKAGLVDVLPSPSQGTVNAETSLRLKSCFYSFLRVWRASSKGVCNFFGIS